MRLAQAGGADHEPEVHMSEEARRKAQNPRNMKAGRKHQDDAEPREASGRGSRTSGENRDFDQHGASKNQAHGHPREERKSDRRG